MTMICKNKTKQNQHASFWLTLTLINLIIPKCSVIFSLFADCNIYQNSCCKLDNKTLFLLIAQNHMCHMCHAVGAGMHKAYLHIYSFAFVYIQETEAYAYWGHSWCHTHSWTSLFFVPFFYCPLYTNCMDLHAQVWGYFALHEFKNNSFTCKPNINIYHAICACIVLL